MNILTMGVDFAELSDAEIEQRGKFIYKCDYCSDTSANVYHSTVIHTKGAELVKKMPFCNKIEVH